MEASLTPEVQRIVFIDGPAILTADERVERDDRYGLSTMRGLLRRAVAEGSLPDIPIEAMSQMRLAASQAAALRRQRGQAPDRQGSGDRRCRRDARPPAVQRGVASTNSLIALASSSGWSSMTYVAASAIGRNVALAKSTRSRSAWASGNNLS